MKKGMVSTDIFAELCKEAGKDEMAEENLRECREKREGGVEKDRIDEGSLLN